MAHESESTPPKVHRWFWAPDERGASWLWLPGGWRIPARGISLSRAQLVELRCQLDEVLNA